MPYPYPPGTTGQRSPLKHLLRWIEDAFDNPKSLWDKSFDALTRAARAALLTLTTMPEGPVDPSRLRVLLPRTDTLDWQHALKSLEPAWIQIGGSESQRTVIFSNPSCRDYLLGRIDDPDLAEDCIPQLQSLEQLLTLGHAAGLITVDAQDQPVRNKPHLAIVLNQHRDDLADRVRRWVSLEGPHEGPAGTRLRVLRDAAIILAAFGHPERNSWILDQASALIAEPALPTHDALGLARRLDHLAVSEAAQKEQVVNQLLLAGLSGAKTPRDLAAYEALPERLLHNVHRTACIKAREILDNAFEHLLTDLGDLADVIEIATALNDQALWYGHPLPLGDLHDRIQQ